MLSSVFGVAGSGFRPLTKILDCCLPLKSGPFSVPVRRNCLSTPLSIIGLVCFYPTNYHQKLCQYFFTRSLYFFSYSGIRFLIHYFRMSSSTSPQCFLMSIVILLPYTKFLSSESFDLQCLIRANSVHSEPEPNSHSYRYIYMFLDVFPLFLFSSFFFTLVATSICSISFLFSFLFSYSLFFLLPSPFLGSTF